MNFWRLQCFVALAEEEHFGRAANRLFISQPALSQQIKQLEESLGVALVIRQPVFKLTPAGAELYPDAIQILKLVNQTIQRMAPDQGAPDGQLRLLYGRSISSEATYALIEGFREQAPSVKITAQTLWTTSNLEMLRSGQADAAFVRLPLEQPETFEVVSLGKDRQVIAVRKDHPLAKRTVITAEDLLSYELVHWPRDDAPGNFDAVLKQITDLHRLQIGDPQPDQGHRLAATAKSDGYALLHEREVPMLPDTHVAVTLSPEVPLSEWGFVWDGAATHEGARNARSLGEYLRRISDSEV